MRMTKTKNASKHNLEVRVQQTTMTSSGDMVVSGYVNMTNTLSYELGFVDKFVEKIAPGAFERAINRSIDNGEDIDFLAEHDDSLVLASTKNETLKLYEDETGLFIEARIINTSTGRDYYEMIKSGIVTNMSFGFYAVDDTWDVLERDLYERTVNELELFEVSAVRRPAYAASTISSRGLDISNETVPESIKEDFDMEQRTADKLLLAISELTNEVRELRGTMGKDVDGNTVNVQKDNYAVGQQTSEQAGGAEGEATANHKVIKEGENLGKYAGDKEIDDKGSYNHDKNVPHADDSHVVTNKPESQSGKTAEYDGSHPDDVPGEQGGETAATTTTTTTAAQTTTTTTKPTTTTTTTVEQAGIGNRTPEVQNEERSYSLFKAEFDALRGGNK